MRPVSAALPAVVPLAATATCFPPVVEAVAVPPAPRSHPSSYSEWQPYRPAAPGLDPAKSAFPPQPHAPPLACGFPLPPILSKSTTKLP